MVNALALMQSDVPNVPSSTFLAAMGTGFMLVVLVLSLVIIASFWKIFTKAGKPGWAALVPIYNFIVLAEVVNKPLWWAIIFMIPLIGWIMASLTLAERFGKGMGFAIGLIVLPIIFLPMLAFSDSNLAPATA